MNGTEEAQNAYQYNKIRVFTASLISSHVQTYDLLGIEENWSVPSEQTLGNGNMWTYFSATCWFFGRNLYQKVNVPIGLLVTSWGGTNVEKWMSNEALNSCKTPSNPSDSQIWNSMVHPLVNMTIFGAVWYQGESNAGKNKLQKSRFFLYFKYFSIILGYNNNFYNCTFPTMIDDWRYRWYEGTGGLTNPEFPFGFVQIANFSPENITIGTYPSLRFHQTADYGYAPNPRQR